MLLVNLLGLRFSVSGLLPWWLLLCGFGINLQFAQSSKLSFLFSVRFFHWLWRNFGGLFPRLGARNSYFLIAVTTLRNDRGRAFEIADDFNLSWF